MRTERANAKINLSLDIVSRRENGYHNLVSVMQTVSLCDLVTVDFTPSVHTSITLSASGNSTMPCDCRNLAWRAAEKFLLAAGRTGEVRIFLEKHIPMAAGLAGGSTDAAAVLRALNRLCGSPLDTSALCEIGATLGADVPFCVLGGCAKVTGIGEELSPLPTMPDAVLVVACGGEGVSTPWAYAKLDELHGDFADARDLPDRPAQIVSDFREGGILRACARFYNIFEEVVPTERPEVNRIKARMNESGAAFSMMSGSGPSVFGVFPDAGSAERCVEILRESGAAAFVCHPTAKYPEA